MEIKIVRLVAALCLFILPLSTAARADSWALPQEETFVSASGEHRVTIVPAPIDSALEYFRDEIEAEKAGEAVQRPTPLAYIERRNAEMGWDAVTLIELVNTVAPVKALIADETGYLVTFDNWHSVGHGAHVVVIYDAAGKVVRSLQLADIVPQKYVDSLPHSSSSIQWRHRESISADGMMLDLQITHPGDFDGKMQPVVRTIALADGRVLDGRAGWSDALAAADRIAEERERLAAERLVYLREPLSPPKSCDTGDWHGYMREAFTRLTPNYLDRPIAGTTIVFQPTHARHEKSLGWLADSLAEAGEYSDALAVAAPCGNSAFAAALGRMAEGFARGSLSGSTIYIAADSATLETAVRVLTPTGIAIVPIDTAKTIPQRPERIPGSEEKRVADVEIARRQTGEFDNMMAEFGDP